MRCKDHHLEVEPPTCCITQRTVIEFNGPGNNRIGHSHGLVPNIKAGDMVVIPAGTGRWSTKIDDHMDYFMVRIDPDKIMPLKSEAQSKEYLSKFAVGGQ